MTAQRQSLLFKTYYTAKIILVYSFTKLVALEDHFLPHYYAFGIRL